MVRGRPEKLTDEIKNEITRIVKKHPKWKLEVIQNELRQFLLETVKKEPNSNVKTIEAEVNERLPGISSIQKYIKTIVTLNLNNPGITRKGQPWHLGLMADYPIPPEAVPYILMVQDWLEKYPDWFGNPPPQKPLTSCQALWVARFYGMIDESRLKKPKYLPSIARFLFSWAEAYAHRQLICEVSETPFDTSGLDKAMQKHGIPITADKSVLVHYSDKSFYIDTVDRDLLEKMEQMKKEGEK